VSPAALSIRPRSVTGCTLADLAAHIGAELAADSAVPVTLTGVALDNRAVHRGDLFAALPGAHCHGASFAAAATAAGAVAVLTDPAGAGQARATGHPVLVVPNVRAILARAAAFIYGDPSQKLQAFGVTGTNGKTTTTYLLTGLAQAAGRATGLIGTVEIQIGEQVCPARLTTPEAPDFQAILATMVEAGVDTLAAEVSSHALAMGRVGAVTFDVAGFTNLSQDHLDFHHSLADYLDAKLVLFTPSRARRGVVMVDDDGGKAVAARAQIPVVTVTTKPGTAADWQVTNCEDAGFGSCFELVGPDRYTATVHLPGSFNVANAALALVMAHEGGIRLPTEIDLDTVVPGRMEVIGERPRVVVDFAHNAEALDLALATLRPTTAGRLIVVFGATGDRDRTKRGPMGAAAAAADLVVVTDDDPHGEDAAAIRADVVRAARDALPADVVVEIAPRAAAIEWAIHKAAPDDTVLLAGRGHETIQEVGGVELRLDDRAEARRAMASREDRR
jgi:UDP-N-acetylmuramoyl-L-alanyl-D-glutamate--2,6-diaminopimelate ligase